MKEIQIIKKEKMNKIIFDEVKNIYEYEKIRNDFRERIIKSKKIRRLSVGPFITLVFENRETVLFQIQEMMRIERMADDNLIRHEIETYNILVPEKNQLKATMLIEITNKEEIKPKLDTLVGLNKNSIYLNFADESISPLFDEGQFEEDRISAVQYLTFNFSDEQVKKFCTADYPAKISVEHKNYNHSAALPEELRNVLSREIVL